jgi:Ca2+-binding RTX toxin-like protein
MLEDRLLLTSVLSSKGTLAVNGTAGNDTIVVQRHPTNAGLVRVNINGTLQNFNKAAVRRIEVYGLPGNDNLKLDDSLAIISRKGATLFGGTGNDTLAGGTAGITLNGYNGADSILGGSQNDIVIGGDGDDTILGGRGNDRVFAGAGQDSVRGWLGNDMLYGDRDNDTLFGEGGNDTIGGDNEDNLFFVGLSDPGNFNGNDSLNGGDGADWLVGGRQSATLDDNNGVDTLTGGAGNDVLDSRGWSGSGNNNDVITDRAAGDIVPMENFTRQATAEEIAEGDNAYAVHDHADIIVKVLDNGVLRTVNVQGGIGDFVNPSVPNTSPRVHVHDGQEGRIHMHDLDDTGPFTLGEFFRNWGVSIDSTHIGRYFIGKGHTLTVQVDHNGVGGPVVTIADPYNYVIQGANLFGAGDVITITYQ